MQLTGSRLPSAIPIGLRAQPERRGVARCKPSRKTGLGPADTVRGASVLESDFGREDGVPSPISPRRGRVARALDPERGGPDGPGQRHDTTRTSAT